MSIAINNLTWTASGVGCRCGDDEQDDRGVVRRRGPDRAITLGLTQTYALANSWAYATGSYGAVVTYTLTAP